MIFKVIIRIVTISHACVLRPICEKKTCFPKFLLQKSNL